MTVIVNFQDPSDYKVVADIILRIGGMRPGRIDDHRTGVICTRAEFDAIQEGVADALPLDGNADRVTFSVPR